MGLDALLATMETRRADTPDTPRNPLEVSAKPAPIKTCTLDTPDTPEKTITTNTEERAEWRRQKVIRMLNAAPGTKRAFFTDAESDPHNVILAVAVRTCMQTCELRIPKSKYDPWRLLELVERYGQTTH